MTLLLLVNLGFAGGSVVTPAAGAHDLNKAFITYVYATLTGTKQSVDVTTLLAKNLATVRAAQPTEVDDLNTLYKTYLP